MFSLTAKIREEKEKPKVLRQAGFLPGVLYGAKIENQDLQIDEKEFEKIYQEAGESSLIKLKVEKKEFLVLIHDVQRDPITDNFIHVDFYQPSLTEETEADIPLIFEGVPLGVKDLGGTLVKNIKEIRVKALPQNLPHQIKVNVDCLKTFEDEILIKDIIAPKGVKILREPNEVIALVSPPEKVEEELEKPVEAEAKVEEKEGEKEEPASAKAMAGEEKKSK